ncbi:hypothetical protein FDW83_01720 [Pseudarthrobacter sp. NamE2]|uniref:hypothetical protein n=1 Tax=Pseudarthrobacter sp. NamE2 TaxID=2576838 RepID=UPI0010FD5C4A|nr:hypothetical protein [Pseudarthrobacter sp. NamE2]TLM86493.1 hypothetical protein FDW83_01720 [Pseudarthrobacter sp. NamE2]
MTHPHFEAFLTQAVDDGQDREMGLGPDELYGLYTSWCLLNSEEPQAPKALWQALEKHDIKPGHNHLGMKGPAAADYIIASAPDLV